MIHPNSVAVDYVWDKLVGTLFSDEAIDTIAQVNVPSSNGCFTRVRSTGRYSAVGTPENTLLCFT